MCIRTALQHWAVWTQNQGRDSAPCGVETGESIDESIDCAVKRLPQRLQRTILATYLGDRPVHEYARELGLELNSFHKYRRFAEQLIQRSVFPR